MSATRVEGAAATKPQPLPPADLIERFGLGPTEATDGAPAGSAWRGFCGFDGRSGYDDGYDFMSDLLDRGWRDLPAKGDWPYLVYVLWNPKTSRPAGEPPQWAIAEYCEGDLTVWTFDDPESIKAFYRELKDCP